MVGDITEWDLFAVDYEGAVIDNYGTYKADGQYL